MSKREPLNGHGVVSRPDHPFRSFRREPAAGPDAAAGGLLPDDPDAELYALASAYLYSDLLTPMRDRVRLTPDDFARQARGQIYAAMLRIHDRRDPLDVVTLRDELRRDGQMEALEELNAVETLAVRMPEPYGAEQYAGIVRRHAHRRRLITNGSSIARLGYERTDLDAADLVRAARGLLEDGLTGDEDAARFRPVALADLRALPRPTPLVSGVVMVGTHVVVYGDSDAGKSYWVQDLAFTLASEGHGVVYVAAEGAAGLVMRADAWLRTYAGADLDRFTVIPRPVQLLDPEEMGEFVAELGRLEVPPALVVLDTVNRCTDGADENSNSDMRCVAVMADAVRAATGATFLAIHHDGKDGTRGPRGAQCIRSNADTVIRIIRDGDVSRVTCEKQKDGWERFTARAFTLHRVLLDEHDATFGAYVVDHLTAEEAAARGPREETPNGMAPSHLTLLLALRGHHEGRGGPEWHANTDLPRRTFYAAVDRLKRSGLVAVLPSGRYFLTPDGLRAVRDLDRDEPRKTPPSATSAMPSAMSAIGSGIRTDIAPPLHWVPGNVGGERPRARTDIAPPLHSGFQEVGSAGVHPPLGGGATPATPGEPPGRPPGRHATRRRPPGDVDERDEDDSGNDREGVGDDD